MRRAAAAIWSRNVAADSQSDGPGLGVLGSPLLVDDLVIVAAAGSSSAYDRATGKPRWSGPTAARAIARRTRDDRRRSADSLLERGPARPAGASRRQAALGARMGERLRAIVQPALTADGDMLIGDGEAQRHAPHRGRARRRRMDGRRALDVERAQAVVQRLRRPQRPRLRLRRQHPRVHRSRRRQAQVEGRPLRQRSARAARRSGSAAGRVRRRRARAGRAHARASTSSARVAGPRGQDVESPVLAGDVLLVRNGEEMAAFRLARRK